MDKIKKTLVAWMISEMVSRLSPEEIKKWIDKGLDMLEDKIAETPNTTDDEVVLPLIKVLRAALNVPDND